MNILCTICSDLVNQAENIYVTKCGHIFHHHCLAQWIERSKTCPQCRNKVTEKCMFRMYPTVSNENSGENAATLQSRLDDAQLQLRQQKTKAKETEDKMTTIINDLKKNEELLKSYEKKLVSYDSKVTALREQLEYANIQSKEASKLREENENLKKNMQMLNGLQKVLNATSEDVEQMLKGYSDVRTIATFATALKRALGESESKRSETRDRLYAAKQHLALEKKSTTDLQARVIRLEDDLAQTKRDYEVLKCKKEDRENDKQNNKVRKTSIQAASPPLVDLNHAMMETDSCNNSFNTMVNKIENSDSPYLTLKQGSALSLSALQRQPVNIADSRLKPSELVFMNAIKSKKPGIENKPSTSIFHKKETIKLGSLDDTADTISLDISYDGLGGHSKLDKFPVPRPPVKSCIPKLSAKHKLKRPNGAQDIQKMLKKFKDK